MFCPNCGTKNDDGDMFCAQCGTPLKEVEAPEEQEELRGYEEPGQQEESSWQQEPIPDGEPVWQEQMPYEEPSWQEQPYNDSAYQGQQANGRPAQKKPVPKLLIAVIAEAVVAVGLIVGVVKVTGDRFSPETAALNYWEAAMNHEWGKAYDYCSFPDSDLLSRQMYVNANANNDEVLDYESVKVIDSAEEARNNMDELSALLGEDASDQMEDLDNDDIKYYTIEYRIKGEEDKRYSYVTVTKSKDKKFLFWDDWKVTSSDSWVSNVSLTIPENAQMTLNGVEVDGADAEVEDGMKTVIIPYLFTGEYQMSVTAEGMKDYNRMLQVSSGGADESYIELVPSQETVDEIAARSADDIKLIVESALSGKEFSEIESLFTEEALADGYVQEDYEDLVEELQGDGSTSGVVSLQLSNADIELDSSPDSQYIEFYVTMDKTETYRRSWSDELGENNYDLTVYCSYENDGGEWKLSYMPVNSYDF